MDCKASFCRDLVLFLENELRARFCRDLGCCIKRRGYHQDCILLYKSFKHCLITMWIYEFWRATEQLLAQCHLVAFMW